MVKYARRTTTRAKAAAAAAAAASGGSDGESGTHGSAPDEAPVRKPKVKGRGGAAAKEDAEEAAGAPAAAPRRRAAAAATKTPVREVDDDDDDADTVSEEEFFTPRTSKTVARAPPEAAPTRKTKEKKRGGAAAEDDEEEAAGAPVAALRTRAAAAATKKPARAAVDDDDDEEEMASEGEFRTSKTVARVPPGRLVDLASTTDDDALAADMAEFVFPRSPVPAKGDRRGDKAPPKLESMEWTAVVRWLRTLRDIKAGWPTLPFQLELMLGAGVLFDMKALMRGAGRTWESATDATRFKFLVNEANRIANDKAVTFAVPRFTPAAVETYDDVRRELSKYRDAVLGFIEYRVFSPEATAAVAGQCRA